MMTDDEIGTLYRRSPTVGELFGALAKAQGEFTGAKKAGKNPHFHSTYATLESVVDATRDGLAKHGLAIVQMPGNIGGNIAVTTLLGHSSGEWIESIVYVAPMKFDAQGVGSVITYLRRYARAAITGIAPEDDDGEAAVARPSAPAKAALDNFASQATEVDFILLLAEAEKAASNGMGPLEAWWKTTNGLKRRLLRDEMPKLKELATKADTAAGQ